MIAVVKAWTHPRSIAIGLVVLAIVLLWPAIPLKSLSVWLQTLTAKFPTNVLYPLYALVVGAYAALYTYDRTVARCCRVTTNTRSTTLVGMFPLLGMFLGACPACIPALAFFLPLSFAIVIGYYSWLILTASLALLLFSMWRIGGFQRV